ncbi:MAG: helix-turn-helix domain-containing protein [Clostridia bacterium]|nr:helix-turn-helix domain-containing protein [Clostridia bacterium]
MNKFSERLKDLRTEKALSRNQLAEKLNVSARLVAYWENGQRECSFDMLITIADLFATTIDYLIGRTDY